VLSREPVRELRPPQTPIKAKPVLLVVVPADFGTERAAAELVKAVGTHRGNIEIEALAEIADEIQQRTAGDEPSIAVNAVDDFAKIARSFRNRPPTIVGLCHISQMLPPEWLERATNCLGREADIAALTGQVALAVETPDLIRPPFFSRSEQAKKVERFLLGNARAMFSLAQETNSGFAVLRSELMPEISKINPRHEAYGRLKRMGDWIHEIVVALQGVASRFELVPDAPMPQSVEERQTDAFPLTKVMRGNPQDRRNHAADERYLLGRLAIDVGLEMERSRAYARQRAQIAERIGRPRVAAATWAALPEERVEWAALAHVNGQIELALDLAIGAALNEKSYPLADLGALLESALVRISLFELISHGKHKELNLDEPYSFQLVSETQSVVLHANAGNKGIAALVFPEVDLSRTNCFTCELSAPRSLNAIRFRLELTGLQNSKRWSKDRILRGGDLVGWEFDCPEDLREPCRVLLGVEMADPECSSENAFAYWRDPCFRRRLGNPGA
jgi:hypothetical protein